MERTIIGVFDSEQEAQAAREDLLASGIADDRVEVRREAANEDSDRAAEPSTEDHRNWFERLFGIGEEHTEHYGQYAEAVRRGSSVVVVHATDESRVDDACDIMSRHGAIDIDGRAKQWRDAGWTADQQSSPALQSKQPSEPRSRSAATVDQGQEAKRIPVVEEQLKVGKRVADRGGVRVYARTIERPVEEELSLREEHARVDRHSVDRPATAAEQAEAFKEASVEVRESVEEPVVSKTARVVEEVEIGKEVTQRTEKVSDTVRRTDVQVETMNGDGALPGGRKGVASARRVSVGDDLDVEHLVHLLRDELSAMETYRQALDKNRDQYGADARFGELEQMFRDHEQAASQLRDMVRRKGGAELDDSGAWGTWANTVMGTAKLFGDKAALKALKEGEESGIKDYEDVLHEHAPSQEIQDAFMSILSAERQHVQQLDRLIDRA